MRILPGTSVPKSTLAPLAAKDREILEIGNCLIAKHFLHTSSRLLKPIAFTSLAISFGILIYPFAESTSRLLGAPSETEPISTLACLCVLPVTLPLSILMLSGSILWLPLNTFVIKHFLPLSPELASTLPNFPKAEKASAKVSGPLFYFLVSSAISYMLFTQLHDFSTIILQNENSDPDAILNRLFLLGGAWVVNCFSFYRILKSTNRLTQFFKGQINDYVRQHQGTEMANVLQQTSLGSIVKAERLIGR